MALDVNAPDENSPEFDGELDDEQIEAVTGGSFAFEPMGANQVLGSGGAFGGGW